MKNKETIFLSLVLSIFLVFFAFSILMASIPVFAVNNDNVTIDVNVTQAASITVVPDSLNWTGIGTGGVGGIEYLNIKNSGSLNVSQIYAYVNTLETEPVKPYATGNPLSYSAGGVITLKNETDAAHFFAGRIEWNWTQDIPNHDWSNVDDVDAIAWGYFRNASNDYVWVLGNGTDGYCNNTNAEFAIEYDVDLGTTETRKPEGSYAIESESSEWGFVGITDGSSPLNNYCVAAYYDCSKIYIYHYDKRTSPNFASCDNSGYIQQLNLTPGYTIILEVDAWVPNGYPSGWLNTSVLTVYAGST